MSWGNDLFVIFCSWLWLLFLCVLSLIDLNVWDLIIKEGKVIINVEEEK